MALYISEILFCRIIPLFKLMGTFASTADINPIMGAFPDCLIHLTTYEIASVNPKFSDYPLFRTENLLPFVLPLVLSRYEIHVNLGTSYFNCNRSLVISKGVSSRPWVKPSCSLRKHGCVVQMYLNYDRVNVFSSEPYVFKGYTVCSADLLHASQTHGILVYPELSYNSEGVIYPDLHISKLGEKTGIEKLGVFQILLIYDDNATTDKLLDWATQIDILRPSGVSNFYLKFVVFINSTTNRETTNVTFIFGYYSFDSYYTHIFKLGSNQTENRKLLNSLYWHVEKLSQMPSFCHAQDVNFELQIFQKLQEDMVSNFTELPQTFRNFKAWMNTNVMVFMIFQNYFNFSWTREYGKQIIAMEIYLDNPDAHLMAAHEEGFQFLTCGGVTLGSLSLIGYISAFDNMVWLMIFITIGITSILYFVITQIPYKFKVSSSLLNYIMMPLDAGLEQGNKIAVNTKQLKHLYFLSSAWILTMVVISNAYRGQNITHLTHPVPPVKPELFTDLVAANFSIDSIVAGKPSAVVLDLYYGIWYGMFQNYSMSSLYHQKPYTFNEMLKNVENNSIVRKYQQVENLLPSNVTHTEWTKRIQQGLSYFMDKIQSCNHSAFLGWSDQVMEGVHKLKSNLRGSKNYTKAQVNMVVSAGRESILVSRKGWTLAEVTMPILKVLSVITSIHETGIAKQWKGWDTWLKTLKYLKEFHEFGDDPVRLTMNDNISVVFYVHLVLLGFCMVILVAEKFFKVTHQSIHILNSLGKVRALISFEMTKVIQEVKQMFQHVRLHIYAKLISRRKQHLTQCKCYCH